MKVEREIAGFAFPFAAGVSAAILTGVSPCTFRTTYHIITSAAIIVASALLLYSYGKGWNSRIQWMLTCACALGCGVFFGLSGLELQLSEIHSPSQLQMAAINAGKELEGIIDSVPFSDESTGGVIKALLTGNRSGIPSDITQAFRDSGASHILALSGLHLGIIYLIIVKIMSALGNSAGMRYAKSAMTILICWFYTLATGAGASIMRAFIFILLNETARMTGRYTSLKTVLAASLLIHTVFDPAAVSEIGFQLSYAAIFGIAYIYPWLRRIWRNDWPALKWVWESLALSISCQITTGPLAYYYFGTFPQFFLLTNLIAVPLAGLIIPAALATIAMTAMGCCPDFMITATEWLVSTMTASLEIISSM